MLRLRDYPKDLVIGDAIWRVRFVREIERSGKFITWGLCDPCDQVIYIRLGQSSEDRFITFCHELVHAWEAEYEFEIPHELVNKLEKPMARFIIDNVLGRSA